jgi:hypothetical protein
MDLALDWGIEVLATCRSHLVWELERSLAEYEAEFGHLPQSPPRNRRAPPN